MCKPAYDLDGKTHKEQTNRVVNELLKTGKFSVQMLKDDPKKFLSYLFNLFPLVDFSVIAKLVIHMQLFGGTILELGSEYHHNKYFPDINNYNIVGGFAMTEMGHGSNVRQIETVATYDENTKEFIINTPSLSATKFWIGNIAMYGTHVVLFTRLIFRGEDKGVHVIITPLRNPVTGEVYHGVELGDCGPKVGWNGIDNAWIKFTNYRVPRENLLNRFASITEEGEYVTKIASPGKLFQITISQLVFGRLLYVCGPTIYIGVALKIATRYAFSRRQFGEKGKSEELIINYPTHLRTLLPMIATSMAFEFSRNWIINNLQESSKSDEQREEDGAVLYQQLAKFLLMEYKKWYKKQGMTGYIKKEVQSFLATSNPIYTHYRSMPYLLSNEFHHHAFSFRFEKMRSIVIDSLNHSKGKGLSFLQSWNASLNQVIDLAKSYTHLHMLENSQRCVRKCTDPITRHVLSDLIKLYALYNIEQDFAFFRNCNYLSSGKALAISDAVTELCQTLKPYALSIVDSTKFYEENFDIPIAHKDFDYVKHMAEKVGIPRSNL
eukprot:gene15449-18327_t